MRYPNVWWAGLLLCALSLGAVASASAATVFKIATLSPEGSFWMEKMREGGQEVARQTQGRVQFKYYPGGVMGDDKAVIRKMRIGQLQGGAVVGGSLSEFFGDSQIYGLPMVFTSFAEVDHVRSHMDALVLAGLEKGGIVSFGIAEGGFAFIMSRQAVRTLDDLLRQRVWAPDNDPTTLKAVRGFGITPIPLSLADVRASLQTGLIDTVATPPIGAVALQWHTQVRYLLELPLFYIYGTMGVNTRDFLKLSPPDQAVTREVMGRVFRDIDRQNRQDNVSAMETLRKQGIAFIRPSAPELAQWHALGAAAMREVVDAGNISPEFMAIFKQQLDTARSENPKS